MAVAASSIVRLFCAASTGLARANLTTKAKNLFCVNPVISLVPPQIHRRFTSYTREKLFSETSILSDDGKVLHLALQNKDLEMHAVWLRHNCQCPECLSSNGMKTVDPLKLNPSTTAISSVEVSGKSIPKIILVTKSSFNIIQGRESILNGLAVIVVLLIFNCLSSLQPRGMMNC